MQRVRRGAIVMITGGCAAALLAAAPVAAELRADRSAPATRTCGGLSPDAAFSRELAGLGQAHACEHLRARQSTGVSHSSELAAQGRRIASALPSRAPADVGSWSPAVDPGTKTIGISAALFHTGKVLLFGGKYQATDRNTAAYMYDPQTRTGHRVFTPAAVYCGGITMLSDGQMFTSGGAYPKVPYGIADQYLFDPVTEQWTRQPDSPRGRYYPTTTTLADGSVVVTAGTEVNGTTRNPKVEVFTPPATGARTGSLRTVGPDHPTMFYPRQWVMPDGKMLQMDARKVFALNTSTWSWASLPQMPTATGLGAAGLMHAGGPQGSTEVTMIGGLKNGRAHNAVQHFDYANPAAGWSAGTPMPTARSHMNVVQVPDGSAFAIGGNSVSSYDQGKTQTLAYDPKTDRWTEMAVQSVRRAYHSTALLLPDGRIMSAGDTGPGGGRSAVDFYSPPYLFQGPRPQITAAPRQVDRGGSFSIDVSGPDATQAVLMAPAATTHANEMHARHVRLAVDRVAGGFRATVPSATVAPPGWYMLFVLTPDGVPSVADWVHVGS